MGCLAIVFLAGVGWILLGPVGAIIALLAGLLLVSKPA